MNLEFSSEVDSRIVDTDAEIMSELRESRELGRCEIVEAKQKDEVVIKLLENNWIMRLKSS